VERLADNRLRLTLKMINRSSDTEFNPVSQVFNKQVPNSPPYTFLRIKNDRINGGAWASTRNDEPFGGRLEPGEELVATLTTDARDAAKVQALDRFQGPLLWRVQVRRGFVQVRGRDISTTAVIGVDFTTGDIVRPGEDGAARAAPGPGGKHFSRFSPFIRLEPGSPGNILFGTGEVEWPIFPGHL
jgi:hypothetical protein